MFELRPIDAEPSRPEFEQVTWGDPSDRSAEIRSTVDPYFSELGKVPPAAVDLARIAAAAFVADRLTPRRAGFSRSMQIHVQLRGVTRWRRLLPDVEALLTWLSGDTWAITVSADKTMQPANEASDRQTFAAASLLSGGLDSFAGAVLATEPTLFVSHVDNPTTIGAQNKVWSWLAANAAEGSEHVQIWLSERTRKLEPTTRTRAFLFYALATCAASARGVQTIAVPENGFTSLNLALGGDRGGVLSTRSTHPWTMHLVQSLLHDVGLGITFVNPYQELTKGQLVESAAAVSDDFQAGLVQTMSCAKLDGRLYKGGNANHNCGLCVACLTRRASVQAAGIVDTTPYLATTLRGDALRQLQSRRSDDVQAVRAAVDRTIDEFAVLEYGPYPESFDLDAAAALCRRGFAELARVVEDLP